MKPSATAPRQNVNDLLHGVPVADPYRWLETADSEETLAWSAAQREFFEQQRGEWTLVESFAARLTELVGGGAVSTPVWRGERQFTTRRLPGAEHAVLLLIEADGSERVLVDPMTLSPDGTVTLDAWQPSKEGERLAYQISSGGSEESMLFVMDAATGAVLEGPIDRARYSPVAWLPGGEYFYYVRRLAPELLPEDERQYHRRVYLHKVGTDPAHDAEVFGEGLTITNYYDVGVSRDGRWLQITAAEGTAPRCELYWADLESCEAASPTFTRIFAGVDAQAFASVGRDGRLYVHTDWKAPRGRLCIGDPSNPQMDNWQELIAEHPAAVLDRTVILDGEEMSEDLLIALRSEHTVSTGTVHRLADGEFLNDIALPGAGSIAGVTAHPDGGSRFWYLYTDHVTPPAVYVYDGISGESSVWALPPGSVKTGTVTTQQVTYRSKDGTEVRMFIISPAAAPDQPRPAILYGYGGFGISLSPAYSAAAMAWVEAGGIYAVANIRGGGEEGEEWHRAGMFGNKQNVFDDFIAAGEWLIDNGWTSSSQLSIFGGSNGGLLVGATLTQRPDLLAAVVCSAPLLDMVRYELHGLGATWNVEYGSANDPEQFAALHAYSPYHRVVEGTPYPAVLFTVFDGDSRVDPLHARKLAAALQWANASDRPIILRAEANVGHGARAVSRSVALLSEQLAFIAAHTGLDKG